MQYGPKIVNDGLVFFVDGTQNYTGDDAVKTPNDIPNCCLWLDADDDTSVLTEENVDDDCCPWLAIPVVASCAAVSLAVGKRNGLLRSNDNWWTAE